MSEPEVVKRLVLCLDGTWNTDDGEAVSNIVHIRNNVLPVDTEKNVRQIVYYDTGVGTGLGLDRVFGGGLGLGLGENVRQAYRFLSGHFEEEVVSPAEGGRVGVAKTTEIYVFGFSRGAYTARALAGYLGAAGLLKPEHCDAETEQAAWAIYRTKPHDRYPSERRKLADKVFRHVRIRCLGVFDTVGALGVPIERFRRFNRHRYEFHDTELGSNVDVALHALGLDEKRWPFRAAIWSRPNHEGNERVEQVWFPGVHTNIGGGYPDERISQLTLHWMMSRLPRPGLKLRPDTISGEMLRELARGTIYESRRIPLYLSDLLRPAFRKVANIGANGTARVRAVGLPPHGLVHNEYIHWSALVRWHAPRSESGGEAYRPPNLSAVFDRLSQTYLQQKSHSVAPAAPELRMVGLSGEVLDPENPEHAEEVNSLLMIAREP